MPGSLFSPGSCNSPTRDILPSLIFLIRTWGLQALLNFPVIIQWENSSGPQRAPRVHGFVKCLPWLDFVATNEITLPRAQGFFRSCWLVKHRVWGSGNLGKAPHLHKASTDIKGHPPDWIEGFYLSITINRTVFSGDPKESSRINTRVGGPKSASFLRITMDVKH